MDEHSPQVAALQEKLNASDDALASFKNDPGPLLAEHGIELTPEEHQNLKRQLAAKDHDALKNTVSNSNWRMMVSEKP